MLRGLSNVRRRVEQLAGSGRCKGSHRIHRIVHVRNDDPTPPWPEEAIGKRCACGAELEYLTVVIHVVSSRAAGLPLQDNLYNTTET